MKQLDSYLAIRAQRAWSVALLLSLAVASCGPVAHEKPEIPSDSPVAMPAAGDSPLPDVAREVADELSDASVAHEIEAGVHEQLAPEVKVCADPQLASLLGCAEAGVPGHSRELGDASAGWASFAQAVEAAVAARAPDGGGPNTCQSTYVACVAAGPSMAGVELCNALARRCGFDPEARASFECSELFASCFLADLFAYEECIERFRVCQAAAP